MMLGKQAKKFVSVLIALALVIPHPLFAQEEVVVEATDQVATESAQLAISEASPSATPETISQPAPADATQSAAPVPTPSPPPIWILEYGKATTTAPVVVGETYRAPQNEKVTVAFTRLPDPSGTLSIEEVRLSLQEKEELSAVSDIAYEITSSMEDGTFEYTLTLPTSVTENVEVRYSEDGQTFVTLGNVTAQAETLTITGLTHFTLFVVTTVSNFGDGVSTDTTITDVGGGDGDVTNALGGEVADQSQTTGTTAQTFDSTTWLVQTFTAGVSGLLTKVRLSVRVQSGDDKSGNVTVELRTTSGGAPTSTVLASTTADPNTLPSVQGNFDFTFSSPASVSLGTTYAIVVYRGATGNASNYDWYSGVSTTNQYAPGAGYGSSNSGASWTLRNSGRGDQRFTTYVRAYATSGTQTSDVLNTGLATTKFVRLAWTEDLSLGTDITFEIRASSSAFLKSDGAPAWISLGSANSPASLAAVLPDTYQYFQWRATLSGAESVTPTLHDVTTTYLFLPTASPAGGDYFSDQTVTLSSEAGTTIRYTTDGTTPTASTGTVYTDPIAIGTDATLKAVAVDTDGNVSSVLSETYSIAPVISAEASGAVGSSSVTITWTTDDLSTSRVLYDTVSHPVLGTAPNYGYASSTAETDTAPKVTAHSVAITGLTSGTTYHYRTVSKGSPEAVGSEKSFTTGAAPSTSSTSGDGGGGAVLGASTTCGDAKPGSAPTLLSATSGVNSVTLTWSPASDPVSYYLITYGTSPGAQTYGNPDIGGKGTTSYTVNDLSGGVTYYFRVRAGNGCMPGDFSNELSATARGAVVGGPAPGFAPGVLGVATPSGERVEENPSTTSTTLSTGSLGVKEDKASQEVLGTESKSEGGKSFFPFAFFVVLAAFFGLFLYLRLRKREAV